MFWNRHVYSHYEMFKIIEVLMGVCLLLYETVYFINNAGLEFSRHAFIRPKCVNHFFSELYPVFTFLHIVFPPPPAPHCFGLDIKARRTG